jgi:hypothetical protein
VLTGGNFALGYQELITEDHTWINGNSGEETQSEICASSSMEITQHFDARWSLRGDEKRFFHQLIIWLEGATSTRNGWYVSGARPTNQRI